MGFENDKLNRKYYADILNELVLNPEVYKRFGDSKSLTVAIDSAWGTGKTYFIDMWVDELNKNKENIIVKYNAWENDFASDPFESLAYHVITHDIFNDNDEFLPLDSEKEKKDLKKVGLKLLNIFYNISKILGKNILKYKFGIDNDAIDDIKEVIDNVKETGATVIEYISDQDVGIDIINYKNYKENISRLCTILTELCMDYNMVIIIDELDRCKPTFAIQLLEIVKHIFNVENLCFVFALDMTQLSHSIKCVYGQDMDSIGYLQRFFDYIHRLPEPDKKLYINYIIEKNSRNTIEKLYYNNDTENDAINLFSELFYRYSKLFSLSLRDINIIYHNFLLFEKRELIDTYHITACSIYLFLFMLKYKLPELFSKIFNNNTDINISEILNQMELYEGDYTSYYLCEDIILYEQNIDTIAFTINSKDEDVIHGIKISVILSIGGYYIIGSAEKSIRTRHDINLSNILYRSDIERYNRIKSFTLKKYIQFKIELYNFNDIPTISTDILNNYFSNNAKIDLSGANLSDVNLSDVNLSGANLTNANLTNANLTNADLSGANLTNADLSNTHLIHTHLIHADLSGANLNGANLTNADLSGANLNNADLSHALVNNTTFSYDNIMYIEKVHPMELHTCYVIEKCQGDTLSYEEFREIYPLKEENNN